MLRFVNVWSAKIPMLLCIFHAIVDRLSVLTELSKFWSAFVAFGRYSKLFKTEVISIDTVFVVSGPYSVEMYLKMKALAKLDESHIVITFEFEFKRLTLSKAKLQLYNDDIFKILWYI